MIVLYNLTNITTGQSSHGILGFTQGINNTLLSGWLGILILIMLGTVFFIHFIYRNGGDAGRALGATAFLCFGLSILLRALNLIPDMAMFICLITTAIVIALTFRN